MISQSQQEVYITPLKNKTKDELSDIINTPIDDVGIYKILVSMFENMIANLNFKPLLTYLPKSEQIQIRK